MSVLMVGKKHLEPFLFLVFPRVDPSFLAGTGMSFLCVCLTWDGHSASSRVNFESGFSVANALFCSIGIHAYSMTLLHPFFWSNKRVVYPKGDTSSFIASITLSITTSINTLGCPLVAGIVFKRQNHWEKKLVGLFSRRPSTRSNKPRRISKLKVRMRVSLRTSMECLKRDYLGHGRPLGPSCEGHSSEGGLEQQYSPYPGRYFDYGKKIVE